MQSVIVVSRDKKNAQDYVEKFCKDLKINQFDITIVEQEKPASQLGGSIGIEIIRNIHKIAFLTPIKGKTKAIIIKNADMLTLEAQNALLKILEEPPLNCVIILLTQNQDMLLPTVYSRCKIINISTIKDLEQDKLSTFKSSPELAEWIELSTFNEVGISEKLKYAQDIAKSKQDSINWLEDAIPSAREKLLTHVKEGKKIDQLLKLTRMLQKAYVMIQKTNVQPRFILEQTFLNI